jgi:hypothetical protein
VVLQYVRLGNNAAITVAIGGADRPPLFLLVPLHIARERGIARGVAVRIVLLVEGIHLMPADAAAGEKDRRMQPASDVAA